MRNSLILILFCTILLLAVPVFVQAQGGERIIIIPNPLQYDSIDEILVAITGLLKIIAIGIGTIMVIWSGIMIMTAGGSEEKITKGKKTLTWTIIGVAIIVGVDFLVGFVTELLGGTSTICG